MNGVDWYAGRDLRECCIALIDNAGPECALLEEPNEISDEVADRLKHCGDDGELSDNPLTFREYLAHLVREGQAFPCPFASTEH